MQSTHCMIYRAPGLRQGTSDSAAMIEVRATDAAGATARDSAVLQVHRRYTVVPSGETLHLGYLPFSPKSIAIGPRNSTFIPRLDPEGYPQVTTVGPARIDPEVVAGIFGLKVGEPPPWNLSVSREVPAGKYGWWCQRE